MQIDEQGRHEPPHFGAPVEVVAGFHRFLRETLIWKCEGLSEEQLRWSPVPSGTCLLGILKHSVEVERWWINRAIGNHPDLPMLWGTDDPDADWRVESDDTFTAIRARFEVEAMQTEALLAKVGWDDATYDGRPHNADLSVGWILSHMVEEVARHCGQADIIREMIDGQTGE